MLRLPQWPDGSLAETSVACVLGQAVCSRSIPPLFLKHFCIYLQAASSSLGDQIPKPQGLQEILSGHTTSVPNVQGPQMALMERLCVRV